MNKAVKIQGYEDRVREVMKLSGLSIVETARRMSCDPKVFHSGHQLNSGHLARFCAVTGCSADYILGLSREVKRK